MALESPVPRSAAGIVEDSTTHSRHVPTTLRSDGTARKELKIRPGFTPLEDVGRFRSPRVAQRAAREGSPQLGAGLGGRSLESWANDALKDQGIQNSPLRGGTGSRSTPSSFRAPPVFPSLSELGDALPSSASSRSTNDPAPHQAPLDPSTSSAPSSPPPRRPWPSRNPPPSSVDTNSIFSTPPTRPSSPPTQPPLHAPHAMVTDTLDDNKAPPSPASYSKTRRTKNAPSSSSSQPHTVQSDWNAAKHCFTAPPPHSRPPQQHRRTSSSSAGTLGSSPPQAGGGSSSANAPPSSFNNTVPKRRGQHGRSNSSTSSNTSNKSKPLAAVTPSIPPSPPKPQSQSTTSSSFASTRAPPSRPPFDDDLISLPAPSPIDSPPLIIVKLPPSRIKPTPPVEEPAPAPVVVTSTPTSTTFNNKPIPTGPRNPGPAPTKRVGGSWGAPTPTPTPAPAPPVVPSVRTAGQHPPTSHASSNKPPPPHLLPTPTPTPPPVAPTTHFSPTPPVSTPPPPPPALTPVPRPPRVKSEGGTWGLQAANSPTLPTSSSSAIHQPPLEVAVHLPPSESKLFPPTPPPQQQQQQQHAPRVSVPISSNSRASKKNGNGNGHKRGNSSVSNVPVVPANGLRVVESARKEQPGKPALKEVKKEGLVEKKESAATTMEMDLPVLDDPAAWGVPLSGRSWADDDDSF